MVHLEVEATLKEEEVEAKVTVAKEDTTHLEARVEATPISLRMVVEAISRSMVSRIIRQRDRVTSTSTQATVRARGTGKVEAIHTHSSTDSRVAARIDINKSLEWMSQSASRNRRMPSSAL